MNIFPPANSADEDGIVAIGGQLNSTTLYQAYAGGIFPWPVSPELPMAWFSPDPRGVLFLDKLHLSKSLLKEIRREKFKIKVNHNFEEVIKKCASIKRKKQNGTWITPEIIQGYIDFHLKGFAYSIETYLNDDLVGGIYGVQLGEFFSGESMFSEHPNASKIALANLCLNLKSKGVQFLDTQMVTEVVHAFGGEEITRESFLNLLSKCDLNKKISLNKTSLFD